MGNCVEESSRERIIEEIVRLRFSSERPDDRLGARDLRRGLARMTLEELERRLGRMKEEVER